MAKATCILCDNPVYIKIIRGKYILIPICKKCRTETTEALGPDWETSEWWLDMKQHYYQERSDNWKAEELVDSLDAKRENPANRTDDIANLYGEPDFRRMEYTIFGIILRLYRTYGYGNRRIHAILTNTYKLSISRRSVAYAIAEIKNAGIQPDEDALFWKSWHQTLARLEKEYGIVERD